MEQIALAAALLSALFFGMEGIVGKRGIEAGGNAMLTALMVALISMLVFGGIAFANTGAATLASRSGLGIGAFFFSGVLASGLGVLATWQGVDRIGASVNTAIVNSRPLFAAFLGYLFLSESLELTTVGGIMVLVIGLVLIGLSKGGDIRGWELKALIFPLSAAVVFALGNVLRRYALSQTDIPLFEGIAINAFGGLTVLAGYAVLTDQKKVVIAPRRAYGWFLLTGLSTATALLALFFALEREQVAIIDAIVATAPFFTLLLTWLFLGNLERITLRLLIGAFLVVLGAIFIVGL